MYLLDNIKNEINYFRSLNDHFTVQLGNKNIVVSQADDKTLFMLLSASLQWILVKMRFLKISL